MAEFIKTPAVHDLLLLAHGALGDLEKRLAGEHPPYPDANRGKRIADAVRAAGESLLGVSPFAKDLTTPRDLFSTAPIGRWQYLDLPVVLRLSALLRGLVERVESRCAVADCPECAALLAFKEAKDDVLDIASAPTLFAGPMASAALHYAAAALPRTPADAERFGEAATIAGRIVGRCESCGALVGADHSFGCNRGAHQFEGEWSIAELPGACLVVDMLRAVADLARGRLPLPEHQLRLFGGRIESEVPSTGSLLTTKLLGLARLRLRLSAGPESEESRALFRRAADALRQATPSLLRAPARALRFSRLFGLASDLLGPCPDCGVWPGEWHEPDCQEAAVGARISLWRGAWSPREFGAVEEIGSIFDWLANDSGKVLNFDAAAIARAVEQLAHAAERPTDKEVARG